MSKQILDRLERIESLLTDLIKTAVKLYDLLAASEYLRISRSHLYQLTSKGLIAHYKPAGKKVYFDKADLDAYLLRHRIASRNEIEKAILRQEGKESAP